MDTLVCLRKLIELNKKNKTKQKQVTDTNAFPTNSCSSVSTPSFGEPLLSFPAAASPFLLAGNAAAAIAGLFCTRKDSISAEIMAPRIVLPRRVEVPGQDLLDAGPFPSN